MQSPLPPTTFLTIADLKQVYATTFKARHKWENILLALNVSRATIKSIGDRGHDNPNDCYREGLSEWLEGGERSWGDFVKALSTVGHNDIAMAIEKDFLQALEKRAGMSTC